MGFKDGLVRKIIGLIGFVCGILFAFEFSDEVGFYLTPVFNNEVYFANLIAGFLIFFLAIIITSIVKRIIHPLDKVNRFINQLLGGLAGIVQVIFFISGFLLFLNIFSIPSKETRVNSLFYKQVSSLVPNIIDFVLGKDSDAIDYFQDYIEGDDSVNSKNIIDTMEIDSIGKEND